MKKTLNKILFFMLNYLNDESGNIDLTGGAGSGDGDGSGGSGDGVPGTGEPGGDTPPSDIPEIEFPDGLDDDLKADPTIKTFLGEDNKINYANLIKSYVHAQRKLGQKGVHLPDSNSSDEDWANFYNMLRPAEIDKYEVTSKLDEGAALDEEVFNGFKELAHKSGLTQKQAQNIVDWFNSSTSEKMKAQVANNQEAYSKEVEKLKSDWGENFQNEATLASRALKEFADENTIKYMKDSGLAQNVTLMRLFNKIGHSLMEDDFKAESTSTFGMTKDAAEAKYNQIISDFSGPYFNADHADHKRTVKEVEKLMEAMNR